MLFRSEPKSYHSVGEASEYALHIVTRGGLIAWDHTWRGDFAFSLGLQAAKDYAAAIRDHQAFIDVHAWTFTPGSLHLMIDDLRELGYIDLHVERNSKPRGLEFYMILRRSPPAEPGPSRLQLLRRIKLEMLEGAQESLAV